VLALIAVLVATPALAAKVVEIRIGNHPTFTRVVFELDRASGYRVQREGGSSGSELVVTLNASSGARSIRSKSPGIATVEVTPGGDESVAHVALRKRGLRLKEMILANPPRIVLDVMYDDAMLAKLAPKPKVAKPTEPGPEIAKQPEPAPKAAEIAKQPAPDAKAAKAPVAPPETKPAAPTAAKPAPAPVVAKKPEPAPEAAKPPKPEPLVAKAPEPRVATPEPKVAKAPEPKAAKAPESTVAKTPDSRAAKTPEPVAKAPKAAPAPSAAKAPEPEAKVADAAVVPPAPKPAPASDLAKKPEPAQAAKPAAPVVAKTPAPAPEKPAGTVAPKEMAQPVAPEVKSALGSTAKAPVPTVVLPLDGESATPDAAKPAPGQPGATPPAPTPTPAPLAAANAPAGGVADAKTAQLPAPAGAIADAKAAADAKTAADAKAAGLPVPHPPDAVRPPRPAPPERKPAKTDTAKAPATKSQAKSWMPAWLPSPILLGAGGGLLVCAIGFVFLMRRRRTLPNDLDVTAIAEETGAGASAGDSLLGGASETGSDPASFSDLFDDEPQQSPGPATLPARRGVREEPPGPATLPARRGAKDEAPSAATPPARRAPREESSFDNLFGDAEAAPAAKSKGDAPMTRASDLPADPARTTAGPQRASSTAAPDTDVLRVVHELERRMGQLEAKLAEANEARERLERQVAAQSEELRVQRAAIARTQRALRTMSRGDEDKATEPALRDGDTQTRTRSNPQ
jgi:hypothetical protein